MGEKALEGLKVLEYTQFVAGPYCAKLLADLGAEVIKIEEPGVGDEARSRGPFPNDIPHPERSGLFLYLNTNKLGITLNPKIAAGKDIFRELVKRADILIEDKSPQMMKELGLSYQALKEIDPRLIMTSITPFGQTGPYAEYKAYPLNSYHGGFLGYLNPTKSPNLEREPLQVGGFLGEHACGLTAALPTLAALYSRGPTGRGQHVDVSKQEALAALQRFNVASYPNRGIIPTRLGERFGIGGLMPCQDGHVVVVFAEDNQWQALVELMGSPEWAQDEKYKEGGSRAQHCKEIEPLILEWLKNYTKQEIYHQAQGRCPVGPVASAEEVVKSEQLEARGFFVEIDHPEAGRIRYPTVPYQFSETPWAFQRPAPLLGEHNEEIYCRRLGYTRQELVKMKHAGII